MPIEEASAELKILDDLRTKRKTLIERMDRTFGYFRGDKFKIPIDEGKWESVTSNRAQAEGWKIINVLASAKCKLSLAIDDAKEAERDKYAKTEMVANGMLYSADRRLDGSPEQPLIHSQMVFYRVTRGWGSYRLLVLDDEDGAPYLDLLIWDPRNVFYIPGRDRLLKSYAERQVTEAQAKEEYKGWNGKGDSTNGLVEIVDVWGFKNEDKDEGRHVQEAVIIGSEYVREPTDVKIGGKFIDYLPIRIKAGGPIPLINDTNSDNIAHVGEDYLVNNRELIEEESRAMSYDKTLAGMDVKMPQVVEWDSSKGDLPPEFKKDPYVKGSYIFLDKFKGQAIATPLPLPRGEKAGRYSAEIAERLNTGGLGRIAFGEIDVAMTAFGTDILNKNTREHIWAFKLALEQDYIWMAQEIVRQYKLGGYKESEFTGYNSKFKRFTKKIKPDEIVTDKEFQCSLIVDELSDRAAKVEMAIKAVNGGILSRRTALDIYQLSEDPDQEIQNIEQEQFDKMVDMPLVKGAVAQIEDYADSKKKDAKKAFILEHIYKILKKIEEQYQPQTEQPMAEGLTSKNPQVQEAKRRMTARTPQGNIPAQVREAVLKSQGELNANQ